MKPPYTSTAERLFDAEANLRAAALSYSEIRNDARRRALRGAALSYARIETETENASRLQRDALRKALEKP